MPGDFEALFDDDSGWTESGALEVLPGGWGFLRRSGSRGQDVYVPQAEIRRLALNVGDAITGRVRPPKETERFPVLIGVVTVNGFKRQQ
jgi:transcription termination factor Rho